MSASLSRLASRFPLVLLCGFIGTVAALVEVASNDPASYQRYLRIAMTAALGMPLFFSLHLLSERGKRWMRLAPFSGILLPAAYYYWLIPPSTDWLPLHRLPVTFQLYYNFVIPQFAGWPLLVSVSWGLAFAGLHFFAAMPACLRGREGIGFWEFNRRVFLRFCLATLYTGVLIAGLELALLSADQLFELRVEKGYAYLYLIMAGCFHPACFLSGVPRDFDGLEVDASYPRGLKAFTQFALAPLVAVYTAMLYAYAIKITLGREWPHGFVAMPVFILAGAGISCALLLHPLRALPGEKWARWFCMTFPWTLAPLSLLLLLSLQRRIAEYGVTEYRYLGIVSGCWIAAWALIYIIRKDAGIRWVPASLAVLCLAAAFGPWDAATISRNSQYRRLVKRLRAHGLMIADEFHAPREALELPAEETEKIRSAIEYLVSMHGGESVHRLFGGVLKNADWPNLTENDTHQAIWVKMNLRSAGGDALELHYFLKGNDVQNLEGFGRATYIRGIIDSAAVKNHGALSIDHGVLRMKASDEAEPETVPVENFVKSLPQVEGAATSAQMTLDWTQKGRPYRILFTGVTVKREAGKPPHIYYGSGMLYER